MRVSLLPVITCVALLIPGLPLFGEKEEKAKKVIAGKADVLRHVVKKFARYIRHDEDGATVHLHFEGEKEASSWPVLPDAEIKIHGWWGRLEQLHEDGRVWVWLMVDRKKNPHSVLMIADEMSEQDIHDEPLVIKSVDGDKAVLHLPGEDPKKVPERTLHFADTYQGPRKASSSLFAQSSGNTLRAGHDPEEFETLRSRQQNWLRDRWREEGLPGSISGLHPLGGEMEVTLDHEAIRWGRYLKKGDEVRLGIKDPVKAVVKSVSPWRERTRVHLVPASGLHLLGLKPGQRVNLKVPEPPGEVQASHEPTDLDRLQDKEERVQWFLQTIYCSCGIPGDRCTGMFYIQASCNVKGCGRPKEVAAEIRAFIDEDLSDREIFAKLVKDRGRDIWRPHLLR